MTIASMTGFARRQGSSDEFLWAWELKCVNGRNLDVRCRFPTGLDALDGFVRAACAERLKRGNLSVMLTADDRQAAPVFRINEVALAQIGGLLEGLKGRIDAAPPRLDGLIGLKGVLEIEERQLSPEAGERRIQAMQADFLACLADLQQARLEEGRKLAAITRQHLGEIERLGKAAAASAAAQPAALRERLARQIAELLPPIVTLPEERLAQEVALLAAKADVREELDRLGAHVAAARGLLEQGGAIGRRLDFLCQEFNREANTLCSKADDLALTNLGIELKAAIEQLREQAQNIE
ncbi:MAG TPA: YicC/YloC family endoribonuclease [Dongiaceae bacterium]|nr:YicC/YloC family endoribonuclease [Dongiaceae bacterium]